MGGAICVTQPLTERARVLPMLSQVQIEEQERVAYDRLSQGAAGRVERLLELLKQ